MEEINKTNLGRKRKIIYSVREDEEDDVDDGADVVDAN